MKLFQLFQNNCSPERPDCARTENEYLRRMDGFVKGESCCCDVDQISRKKWKKDLQRKRQVEVDKYFNTKHKPVRSIDIDKVNNILVLSKA